MKSRTLKIVAVCVVILAAILLSNRLGVVQGQQKKTPGEGFAAVPGAKGGQDPFGPYDPVPGWPKPLAESMPNEAGWTWSQATDVFPESPDRVIVLQKGLLPVLPRNVQTTWLPQIGPGIRYPPGIGVPLRESASATPSCGGRPSNSAESELCGGDPRRRASGNRLEVGASSWLCSTATAT